jgi:hypothetical protein
MGVRRLDALLAARSRALLRLLRDELLVAVCWLLHLAHHERFAVLC